MPSLMRRLLRLPKPATHPPMAPHRQNRGTIPENLGPWIRLATHWLAATGLDRTLVIQIAPLTKSAFAHRKAHEASIIFHPLPRHLLPESCHHDAVRPRICEFSNLNVSPYILPSSSTSLPTRSPTSTSTYSPFFSLYVHIQAQATKTPFYSLLIFYHPLHFSPSVLSACTDESFHSSVHTLLHIPTHTFWIYRLYTNPPARTSVPNNELPLSFI